MPFLNIRENTSKFHSFLFSSFPKNNFKTKTKREDRFVKKRRLSPDKINYHFIRLMSFTDCPRCANQGLVMPLVKEENRYVCSMCKSVYQSEEN